MSSNGVMVELTKFFKTARHLWGRCPCCGDLFRLSDAAISFGDEAPADWLRKLQRKQESAEDRQLELDSWQANLERQERDLEDREHAVTARERNLDKTARQMAKGMVKDEKTVKELLREARRQSIKQSRSTLLGNLFERCAPFFQQFGHDPRDVRALMNPIDYVVFEGLTVHREVERIVFAEVKCGTSTQSATQKSIVEAVRQGRVGVEIWQFGKRGIPLEQQLLSSAPIRPALPPVKARAQSSGQ